MEFLIGFIVGCSLMFPVIFIVRFHTSRKKDQEHAKQISILKELHRKEFEELIAKVNHQGPIKDGVTALGLMGLILSAIKHSINNLEELYAKKDWNTQGVITELQEIVMTELRLLYNKVADFIESIRNHLKDYNHKQE